MIKVPISKVKTNPNNPRIIKDEKFEKLVKSIQDFPEMLELRPIVVNDDMVVLGGNMRLKACQEAGLKEVPIIKAQLNEDKQRQFIIKDNVGYGEWDWDILANEWDEKKLEEWGVDLIKHDWNNLDYIDEEIAAPVPLSHNEIVIVVSSNYQVSDVESSIKTYLSENFAGCEVK